MTNTLKRLTLLAALVLLAAGCKQADNFLNPDTNLPLGTGAGNLPSVDQVTPGLASQLGDDNGTVTGIQATVVVAFSDLMDEASVLSSTSVTNTTTGEPVQNLKLTYAADARKLYVRHEDWTSNNAYLLRIATAGAKNRWGSPLDGNRNGTAEVSPYDDYLTTFFTQGSRTESCVGTVPPHVTAVIPDTVRTSDTNQVVSVAFSLPMDTLTLKAANFRLLSGTGSSIQLDSQSVVPGQATFRPRSPLRYGDTYRLVLVDTAIRASGLRNTPAHVLRLDTDGDGAEATEPEWSSYFLCDTVPAPTVSVSSITRGRRFQFSVLMDSATLTAATVRVFDSHGYVPGSLVLPFGSQGGVLTLDYVFARPVSGLMRAFVSRTAESAKGRMLDGQPVPNGIGGEPWDDYWTP
jgi:hypothetical protein